jgi:PfaB family protein
MASASQLFEPLAVVGMDVAWAGCDGLESFERIVYEVRQHFARVEEPGIAVAPAGAPLLGEIARRALQDAGVGAENPGRRVAALACSARPLSPRWDWAISFEDLYELPDPLTAALERAQAILRNGAADLVLFAAGAGGPGLPGDTPLAPGSTAALGFDSSARGWHLGEGAGAVVLMRYDRARREGRRAYAVIRSLAAAPGVEDGSAPWLPPALDAVRGCCRAALDAAGVAARQVGYIEAFASGSDALDGVEIAGLAQAYRSQPAAQPGADLTTAIGSVQANAGYLGAAAGLAGLVRASLCVYHRVIPGAPGWSAPKLPALWRGSPFYVPSESRAWFHNTLINAGQSRGETSFRTGGDWVSVGADGRLAGLSVIGRNGSYAHLVLGEAVGGSPRSGHALARGGFFLFPLIGKTTADLLHELEDLQRALVYAGSLHDLAAEYHESALAGSSAPLGLSIVGHDHEELRREIEHALAALPAMVQAEPAGEWQTPLGSCFSPQPAGQLGGVALVYPGAFSAYPGVARDLFRLFPGLHEHMSRVTADLGSVIRERMLYPRSLAAISKEEMAAIETRLLADPITMLVSGTALAILYTRILQDTFKIHPQVAFGYSLGENSMMYAAGVWGQGDRAAARLEQSEVFRARLAGPQRAIREYWGLPDGDDGQSLWSNYLVMAPPDRVREALAREQRVYLTHINTPRQVVIGGDPQACQRVLGELRCSSLRAPFDYALHCAVMRSEYEALAELHNWPVEQIPAMQMVSAAEYAPLRIEQSAASQAGISQALAHMLTSPLDFPRLVDQVYAGGARVFIEAGAGSNCARWIDESLKGRPHLALSINRRGTDDYTSLVRILARLHSHRVPVDLSPLYTPVTDRLLAPGQPAQGSTCFPD